MNKLIKITLVVVTLGLSALYAQSAHTHSHDSHGHSHQEGKLKSADIQKIALKEVQRLALEKKIPKSWKSMPVAKIGKDAHRFSSDWAVVFKNPKIKKKTKQTLYIFVGVNGEIAGANYTGK